jgi:hypothetical protein
MAQKAWIGSDKSNNKKKSWLKAGDVTRKEVNVTFKYDNKLGRMKAAARI